MSSPVVAVAVLGLGNLLHIVGLATPVWVKGQFKLFSVHHKMREDFLKEVPFEIGPLERTSGLWKLCSLNACFTIDRPGWLIVASAAAILGMLIGLGALGLAGIPLIAGMKDAVPFNNPGQNSFVFALGSFVLILICIFLYIVNNDDPGSSFGYSFYLSALGAVLILAGGYLALKAEAQ